MTAAGKRFAWGSRVMHKDDAVLGALAADKCEATTVTGIRTFVQRSSVDEKLGSNDKWEDTIAVETLGT
jgi:hypothetical protein